MKTKSALKFIFAISLMLSSSVLSHAEETFDTLKVGTNVLSNVRVIQSSPVDVLIGYDGGYKRIPLQELPDEMKAKHPYDASKAADYGKQKKKETLVNQAQVAAQGKAAMRAAFLQREARLQSEIDAQQKELARLDADIPVQNLLAKGKKVRSADRRQLDQLRNQKLDLRDKIWKLQDELKKVQEQRKQYE
ncbi:MAG: hypothetical protein QOD03_979 [Verrucomicrobiota bacterium]